MSEIRIVRDYPHPPVKVWRALTEPALMALWGMRPEGFSAVVGTRFKFIAKPQLGWRGFVECEVLEVRHASVLRYSWVGDEKGATTQVTYTLQPHNGGTRLTVQHAGFTGVGGSCWRRWSWDRDGGRRWERRFAACSRIRTTRHNDGKESDMAKLVVFNQVTLDGYFTDANNDMSWAHGDNNQDPEWSAFAADNASAGGLLLFGRITYEMMASYWPTPQAMKTDPVVAEGMNNLPKVVFSRTLKAASWKNTKLVKADIASQVRTMKKESGKDLVILGSGSIVSQCSQENLIDEYQMVMHPIVLGKGRTMFDGIKEPRTLKLIKTRTFGNGYVLLSYQPKA